MSRRREFLDPRGPRGALHDAIPFGASLRFRQGVWRACGCAQCRVMIAQSEAGEAPTQDWRAGDEDGFTRAVARLLDERAPPGARFTHIASGGARSKGEAGKMVGLGVRRGAPDFVIVVPRVGTIWLELKTEAGDLSVDQLAWEAALIQTPGAFHAVCRSLAAVEQAFAAAGAPLAPDSNTPMAAQERR